MGDDGRLVPRQIWANPTTTTVKSYQPSCTPFLLPSQGIVYLNRSYAITLTANAIFDPICTGTPSDPGSSSAFLDTRDPFYTSVTPVLYAIACATIVSYLLVIILLITPRTFYVGGPGGGANFLGRHGMISGSYSGNSSVVGVGGRPWLQKVAAILVAISLTIASADSFRVAEQQYLYGYSDADALTTEVIDGMEIRVVRVISTTFLWLAQVQTLIRLFPRHKEKIMIKWAGFALIVLDTIFTILDNFLVKTNTTRPRLYEDAIPALSYLFDLALNLLYAAWVIFYSLSKHRFAFFHPKMRNICLVALLSLCAVLIPVVFFVLDIAKPEIAGWGTYVRWVGSAAASVVVWEWVERIEALERDERKDGILGREIFDGDEMLEVTHSEEVDWPRQPYHGGDKSGGAGTSSGWMGLAHRPLRTRVGLPRGNRNPDDQNNAAVVDSRRRRPTQFTPPPAAATPVSRADTMSAASTVYNVHYHPVSSPTPPVAMPHMEEEAEDGLDEEKLISAMAVEQPQADSTPPSLSAQQTREQSPQIVEPDPRWRNILNPFKKRRASLPREVASAQADEEPSTTQGEDLSGDESDEQRTAPRRSNYPFPFNRRVRPGSGRQGVDTSLPVTVIPARNRGQNTWSPQWLTDSNVFEPTPPTRRARSSRPDLRVRVIQPQTGTAAPWTTADGVTESDHRNQELRYDPEAAALVGPYDHVNQVSQDSVDLSGDNTAGGPQRQDFAGNEQQRHLPPHNPHTNTSAEEDGSGSSR